MITKLLSLAALSAIFAGKAFASSPCLPELANERLELRCLTTQLQTSIPDLPLLLRTDYLLERQGYKGFGLVPKTQNPSFAPSIYPIVQYSSNINGGNPPGNLVLGSLIFQGDPEFEQKSGMLYGLGARVESRYRLGEGRFLELNVVGTYARSPKNDIDVSSSFVSLCSKNHVKNWWYVDFCAATANISRDISNQTDDILSVAVSKVISTDSGNHHDLSVRYREIFSENYDQEQVTFGVSSILNGELYTSLYLNLGEAIEGQLVSRWAIGGEIGKLFNGKRVKLIAAYEESDGGALLGIAQKNETSTVGVSYEINEQITIFLGYQNISSSIDYYNVSEPTIGIELASLRF
jgi:hypothetical protein